MTITLHRSFFNCNKILKALKRKRKFISFQRCII